MSQEIDRAIAAPTKKFFVSMLTRDISLADAILDLVDNCLDGILRTSKSSATPQYSNYTISISMSQDEFVIDDNCGGIPREVAKNYAFKMGRDADDERDKDSETIGMYGIGMKRAIFKMGQDSVVSTNHAGDEFTVRISPEWLADKEWSSLELKEPQDSIELGTRIKVTKLFPGVSSHFASVGFIDDLKAAIGEHFTFFLQKGMTILVNGAKVEAVKVEVLATEDSESPAPYVYVKEIDGVSVSIVVGLNTGAPLNEDDDLSFEQDRSAVTAGWTVFCNDRAVIVGDKTRLTGWGDGIPMYHGQFSIITGIVEFRSSLADKLPITTTKRALDTSSNIWLEAKVQMREGLRVWINYTNKWKNHPRSDQTEYWKEAKPLALNEAVKVVQNNRRMIKKQNDGLEFNPNKDGSLPKPKEDKPSSKRIVFSRPAEEIRLLSSRFFDRDNEKAGVIGDKCFQIVLEQVKEQGEE